MSSCLKSTADLTIPATLHPNAKQIKDYLTSYESTPVRDLRIAFNEYQAGRADADTQANLRPYGAALVSEGFYVLNLQGNLAGGQVISVQFHHHPDAQYDIWLYKLSGTTPSVRLFQRVECTPTEQKWMAARYSELMALGDDRSLSAGGGVR